jgi:spermidine synthase
MRNDLLLVASRRPLVHDTAALRARIEREPFASALRLAWMTDGLTGFLGHYVANESFTRAMAERNEDLNTDDRAPVEFGFARNLRGTESGDGPTLLGARAREQHRPALRGPAVDWEQVDWEREAFTYFTTGRAHPEVLTLLQRARLDALSRWANVDFPGALAVWNAAGVADEAAIRIERVMLAELLAHEGDASSEARMLALIRDQSTLSGALRAVWLSRRDRRAEASDAMIAALKQYRTDPWPPPLPMARAMTEVLQLKVASDMAYVAPWLDALSQPFAVFVNDLTRDNVRLQIAWALGETHSACVDVLTKLEPEMDWTESMLQFRLRCYSRHGHPLRDRAQKELERFQANAVAQGR